MATREWTGNAAPVAQVVDVTPATVTVGNDFHVDVGPKRVTFRATAATVANVTAGLASAINASTVAEIAELVAVDGTTKVTLTCRLAGKPATVATSAAVGAGSGTPTLTASTVTEATGPSYADNAANWSGATLPGATDSVVLRDSAVPIQYGLEALTAKFASVTIYASFSGGIGLPKYDVNGYEQYRPRAWTIKTDALSVGLGDGSGAGLVRIKIANTGSDNAVVSVYGTGSPTEAGRAALQLSAVSGPSHTVVIWDGSVSLAAEDGQAFPASAVKVGGKETGSPSVTVGAGATVAALTVSAGRVETWAAPGAVTQTGGMIEAWGGGTISAAMTLDRGTFVWRTGANLTGEIIVGSDAILDASQDLRAREATQTVKVYQGGTVLDPHGVVTWAGIRPVQCEISETRLRLGEGRTLTFGGSPPVGIGKAKVVIGDGTATSFTIAPATHGLAANDSHVVQVYQISNGKEVAPEIYVSGVGVVTVVFDVAPASNSHRVVIHGDR